MQRDADADNQMITVTLLVVLAVAAASWAIVKMIADWLSDWYDEMRLV